MLFLPRGVGRVCAADNCRAESIAPQTAAACVEATVAGSPSA